MDEIKVFRQKRIDGQDRSGVPYRPSSQASSDLSNSARNLAFKEFQSITTFEQIPENPRNSQNRDSLAKTILKMPGRNPTWEKFSGTAAPTFRFLKSHFPSQYASYSALILLNSLAFAALPIQFAHTSLGAPSLT